MGITIAVFRVWRGNYSLKAADLKAMSQQEAVAIYRAEYWNAIHADELLPGIDHMGFDMAVNAGVRRSAMMLQRAANMPTQDIDGVIGPRSLRALAVSAPPKAIIEAVRQFHEHHYRSLRTFSTFGRGWLSRLERRYALSIELLNESGSAI